MKKFTPYFLMLFVLWLLPTEKIQAQSLLECELDFTLKPIGLCGDELGKIDLHITGGFGPYTISWNSFTNGLDGQISSEKATLTLENLPTGPFAIRVTDEYSKCSEVEYTIVEYDILRGTVNATGKPTKCNGRGTIALAITGNTPPYNLRIKGPSPSFSISVSNKLNIYNLIAGDYEIEVEKNGCRKTVTATIASGEGLPSIGLDAVKNSCGVNTGMVNTTIEGGVGPYVLSWKGPTSGSVTVNGSVAVSGLQTGNYQFELKDAKDCKAFGVLELNTTTLAATVNAFHAINGRRGFLKVNIVGGAPGYTIAWTGPESGSQKAVSTTESISLPAGSYTVEVTDEAGCIATGSGVIEERTEIEDISDEGIVATGRSGNAAATIGNPAILVHQNYPNPFTQETTIQFELAESAEVALTIQDHFGRIIIANKKAYRKGVNQFTLNGQQLAAGMYFYTISTDGFQETKRMVVE